MKQNKKKLGIIGCGNMGSAIVQGAKASFDIIIFDKDRAKSSNFSKVKVAPTVFDLVEAADVIVIAVKPQDFDEVLREIKNNLGKKLVISIAAGISAKYIENVLGKAKVIRVMPNLPAKIGKGMSCLCKGRFATAADLKFAEKLFNFLGDTLLLDEAMMNAATAVSGSGPGFLYSLISGKRLKEAKKYAQSNFMPLLAVAAGAVGFEQLQAKILARATTLGSIAFLEKSGLCAQDLVKQVASKGGTTEAGLKVLRGNLKFLPNAVKNALKRAKQLARK